MALTLAGCSGLEGTGEKGYVTSDGRVTELDAGDRSSAISISGKDLRGEPLDLADYRGKVVVMNVWGQWCGECHAEAGDVVGAAEKTEGDDVAFVGINVRDSSPETARSYERQYDVPFPSFYDPSSEKLLAFNGALPISATPSTVVLDREGRVAASVIGVLPSEQTLISMIEKVVAE
ncbi:TlpA disulfide reductase family protein [Nocardioides sp. Bht2]|uniref:TlpA disulfide reductase family protein n=1 Tax=Nocardioides sp. Bht2 TaxID=3392297 RepID=UPI0039B565A2